MNPGLDWLLNRLDSSGRLLGATDLTAYYKTPAALLWNGQRDAAERVLSYVESHYLLPGGDLDGTGVPWFDQYRIYPHAWLAMAAAELRNEPTARSLTGFLLTQRNPRTGAFTARADGSEEIMTTAIAGIACLRNGEAEAAAGVADWLRFVLASQPDLKKELIHMSHPDKGLTRGDGSVAYIVDCSKPRQWYFQYGIAAAFLAEFGDRESAERYLDASAYCFEDRYSTPQSGKIGWGAAWTYRQPHPLITAVASGLRGLQCGDGSWNNEGVYEAKPSAADAARFDVTAEFVALLAQMGAVERV
jgi:hypothetical protein